MNTQSKVAVITGASRGIGAAIAKRLARDGFAVVVNYAGNAAAAEGVVAEIERSGGRAIALQADVSDPAAAAHLFAAAEREFGGVDVLVNNAGVLETKPLIETDDTAFDRHIAVNLKGSFNMMREAGRRVRAGGRIINFSSSVVGLMPVNYAVYAATKSAVEALTHILSKELRGRNVTVNAVAPGPTATELFLDGKPPALIEQIAKSAPLRAARRSRRYRLGRGVSRRTGRWLDQRPGRACQRRHGLGGEDL